MAHSSGGGSRGGYHSSCHSSDHSGSNRAYRPRFRRQTHSSSGGYEAGNHSGSLWPLVIFIVILFFPLQIVIGFQLKKLVFIPEKIENPSVQIRIEDGLDVLSDEASLRQKLTRFYEETGVTPAVKTVRDDQWKEKYPSLMEYAMNEYYRMFTDEKHWLIVYSAPGNAPEDLECYDWSFEGIIGDDTGPSINDRLCDEFTKDLFFTFRRTSDPGEVIGDAFVKLLDKRNPDFLFLNPGTMFVIVCLVMLFLLPILTVALLLVEMKKKNAMYERKED